MTFQTLQRSLLIASLLVTILVLVSCQPQPESQSNELEATLEESPQALDSDSHADEELNFTEELQQLDDYIESGGTEPTSEEVPEDDLDS